jgi:hypothetical protein
MNPAMEPSSTESGPNQTHARSLLADLKRAPGTPIPRRETIVDWLNAYLVRSDKTGYVAGPEEAADLIALDEFLRSHQIPVAVESAA